MKVVAYYRVSTKKQGQSGLGLEGQQEAVESFARQHGGKIITTYTEVETGTGKRERPALQQAVAHAKLAKATLLVAKLDRLARNVAFTSTLMESGVEFIACDNPHANKLTIHILAAVAESEAESISQRTKAALQAAKQRGQKLGSARPGHWDGREDRRLAGAKAGTEAAAKSRRKSTRDAYRFLFPSILEMRDGEGRTYQQIADRLNDDGHTTTRGKPWTATAALRVYRMAKDEA